MNQLGDIGHGQRCWSFSGFIVGQDLVIMERQLGGFIMEGQIDESVRWIHNEGTDRWMGE